MIILQKQYDYFIDNKDRLMSLYEGKFLVISSDFSVKAFDDEKDAFLFGVNKHGLGNFLLQECRESVVDSVQYITSFHPVSA